MGGDRGPEMVLPGVELSLTRNPDVSVVMFGRQDRVVPMLDNFPRVKAATRFVHAEASVAMDAKPSQALRRGRRISSMWKAIEAVKTGEADVVLSAGNTGALMVMARFVLKTMAGIDRPAIAALWPTTKGESIVLDVGATVGADARQLVDFAVMGEAMARALYGMKKPTVGLLNVGVEEVKGIEEVKLAGRMLRALPLPIDYAGFVEGDDLGKGTVNVFVTEGFTGNIALKTAEGTAKQISVYLKDAMSRTILSRVGYFLARNAFRSLREKMDPRSANGGVFLGLNGIVIKSHGGADALGFASAMDMAIDMARSNLVGRIEEDLAACHAAAEFAQIGMVAAS